jgi:hypothetical protein
MHVNVARFNLHAQQSLNYIWIINDSQFEYFSFRLFKFGQPIKNPTIFLCGQF